MRKKILVIEYCSDCPHFLIDQSVPEFLCFWGNPDGSILSPDLLYNKTLDKYLIPATCPLNDLSESLDKIEII